MIKPFTLVVGLGITGLSCARFLARVGINFAVIDSRPEPPCLLQLQNELPEVNVFLGNFDFTIFNDAEQLVISPGISLTEPIISAAQKRGIPIIGDIELFTRYAQAPIVAITGSNGKSTVTTLVGEMAKRAGIKVAVGGNLGTAALDLFVQGNVDLYVLELSSFQLETTFSLNALAATVLNFSPDHLDRHGTMDNYIAAKARVFRGNGTMVINADDPLVAALALPERTIIKFSLNPPANQDDYGICITQNEEWLARGNQLLMPTKKVKIKKGFCGALHLDVLFQTTEKLN